MSDFTQAEIEGIVSALSSKQESQTAIPLRSIAKVDFAPIEGESLDPTDADLSALADLEAEVEVHFGKTRLSLRQIAALKPDTLLPLDNFSDEPVEIYINQERVGRGEILLVEDTYAVKILSLD